LIVHALEPLEVVAAIHDEVRTFAYRLQRRRDALAHQPVHVLALRLRGLDLTERVPNHREHALEVFAVVRDTLSEIESTQAKREDVDRLMRQSIAPALQSVSKCPDLVMDRGHYFEWFKGMNDE